MKKGLLYSIIALAAIVIVAGFNMQIGNMPTPEIPESDIGNILYVCPANISAWNSLSMALHPFMNYIIAGFFFALVLLAFVWGWQLYQNMLSDKFKRESFKTVWLCTKIWFWAIVIVMLVLATPNKFRRVEVIGDDNIWVLCEESDFCDISDPKCHTRVVRADMVHAE